MRKKTDDNKKFWDRFAFIYEKVQKSGKASEQFYHTLETKIAEQLNPKMNVLELAMGPALLTASIAQYCVQLTATDFSQEMVEQAKKKKLPDHVKVEQADATKLPYKEQSFDAVIIANALHIMPNPDQAIREIKRVLKKDGILIAPTYTRDKVESKLKLTIMNAVGFKTFFPWSDTSYKKYLQHQGLEIIHHEVIMCSDFPESFVVCRKK